MCIFTAVLLPHKMAQIANPYATHIASLQQDSYNDFKILYEAFAGRLFGFVCGLTKSKTIAKDVVQETFLRVWLNRKSIDPQQSFKSYLFKIAQNLIIDGFRRQLTHPVFDNYLDYCNQVETNENVEQKIDFDLFVKRLEVAKCKLTPRQREIFEMSKEQNLSVPEIAKHLSIGEQTIYNQLSVALQLLRKEIGSMMLLMFAIF